MLAKAGGNQVFQKRGSRIVIVDAALARQGVRHSRTR
jgi:hypothetical protein